MAQRKRLGINEKDAGAHKIPADDFRRYWVSAEAFSPRNANPAVAANQHDNGFNHLNITAYMLKERELGLFPYRPHINREAAAMELAEPPIILDMHAQHVLRLLLDMEAELRRLAAGPNGEELEEKLILEPGGNYLLFWEMLKASLVWQVPGRSMKDQAETAERVMVDVLEKIVEP
ncbi:hypothetical protein PTT_18762 [Pyrenophora teres f. teres 0-1]|uniref:Uncharacterized protein n=1 Tax=Pyrenophora teres f. teres (strain 0-1) TaxID=861557 RepID=E3S7G5_PYRTT|nr:hypothetical protein PTT_18762 [Pyrenophora teres f. teres 0-1]